MNVTLYNLGCHISADRQPERNSTFGSPQQDKSFHPIRQGMAEFGWLQTGRGRLDVVRCDGDWIPDSAAECVAAFRARIEAIRALAKVHLYVDAGGKPVEMSGPEVVAHLETLFGGADFPAFKPEFRALTGYRRLDQSPIALVAYCHAKGSITSAVAATFQIPVGVHDEVHSEEQEREIRWSENRKGNVTYNVTGDLIRFQMARKSHPALALTQLCTKFDIDRNTGLKLDSYVALAERWPQLNLIERALKTKLSPETGSTAIPYTPEGYVSLERLDYQSLNALLGGKKAPKDVATNVKFANVKAAFAATVGEWTYGDGQGAIGQPETVEAFIRLAHGQRGKTTVPRTVMASVETDAKAYQAEAKAKGGNPLLDVAQHVLWCILQGEEVALADYVKGLREKSPAPAPAPAPAEVKDEETPKGKPARARGGKRS